MAECFATLTWQRGVPVYVDSRYIREHGCEVECDCAVMTSSTLQVVPLPRLRAKLTDPAEAFVAALARSHMVQFLAIAAKRGFRVESYTDVASGLLRYTAKGLMAVSRVTLKPYAVFSGEYLPTSEDIEAMHDLAHKQCFLASA